MKMHYQLHLGCGEPLVCHHSALQRLRKAQQCGSDKPRMMRVTTVMKRRSVGGKR